MSGISGTVEGDTRVSEEQRRTITLAMATDHLRPINWSRWDWARHVRKHEGEITEILRPRDNDGE